MSNLRSKTGQPGGVSTIASDDAPLLTCPTCAGGVLTFISAAAGPDPVDQYVCRHCGSGFEYRRDSHELHRLG